MKNATLSQIENAPDTKSTVFAHVSVLSESVTQRDVAVWVKDGRIHAIGAVPEIKKRAAGKALWVEADDYLVIPGLINAHTHVSLTEFRDLLHGERDMIEKKFFPLESQLKADDVYNLSFGSIYGGLVSGVTCFVDHYYFIESVGQALQKFGVKGVIAETIGDIGTAFPDGK